MLGGVGLRGCVVPRLLSKSDRFEFGGVVPAELKDLADPVWKSIPATEQWLARHGLTIGQELEWGPVNRCKAAGRAWAWEAGLTRSVSYGSGEVVDLERMRELGVSGGWAGQMQERIDFLGIGVVGIPRVKAARKPKTGRVGGRNSVAQ